MLGFAGVTATEATVAGVTMSVADPVMPLGSATWTVLVPTPLEIASPLFGAVENTALPAVVLQESTDVRFCCDPSLYVPVAVNCCVNPFAIVALGGVIAIDTRTADVTVSEAVAVTPDVGSTALTVVEPGATVEASPALPDALDTVATEGALELHVTVFVTFCVVESVYVPVARNCSGRPAATLATGGVIEMAFSTAAVTVSVAVPTMPVTASVAVTVTVPTAMAVASPLDPVAFDTETADEDDIHCTAAVRFCVVKSLYVPVAANDAAVPFGMLAAAGLTAIATRTGAVTVRVVVAVFLPKTALIVVVPRLADIATPALPEAFEMVATAPFELDQVTAVVTSSVDLSAKVPVAAKGRPSPLGMLGATGVIARDVSGAEPTVSAAIAVSPVAPYVAVMDTAPAAMPVACPVESTVAMAASLDVHMTAPASGNTLPSLNLPVAWKRAVVPT
jgi:hypothetical protein